MRFDSQKPPPGGSAFGAAAVAAAASSESQESQEAAAAGSDDARAAAAPAAAPAAAREPQEGDDWAVRRACVERITLDLAARLGVQLLGVDVVFAEGPAGGRPSGGPTAEPAPYVVDVNYFPQGPHSFPGFARALAELARQRVEALRRDDPGRTDVVDT